MAAPNFQINLRTKNFLARLDYLAKNAPEITKDAAEYFFKQVLINMEDHIDTGALYESVRMETKETKPGYSITVRSGGLPSTKNSSGQDYAAYHELGTSRTPAGLEFTRALEMMPEFLAEAVEKRLGGGKK